MLADPPILPPPQTAAQYELTLFNAHKLHNASEAYIHESGLMMAIYFPRWLLKRGALPKLL